jgi:PAS domain S-box-containing protein
MANQSKNEQFTRLRNAAERTLKKARVPSAGVNPAEMETALQELQVHQIELEMQNDELFIANEQVELQRLKFEHIYELAPVGYFILDRRGLVEEVNTAGIKLLETSKVAIRGKGLMSFVLPEQADDFYRFYRQLLVSEDKLGCNVRFLSKSKREFYALLEGQRIAVQDKCYIAMIDVTDSVEARGKLVETNDRLQLALEASAAGTWELHYPSMRFMIDNSNRKLHSVMAGGFSGTYQSFIELVHADDRLIVDQHFRTAINQEREIDIVARFAAKNRQVRYASIRGHLVHIDMTPTEKRFTGIIWDITDKKRLEEMVHRKEQQRQKDTVMATLRAEEKERKRISEALHDSVSQLLYGIKIHLAQLDDENRDAGKKKLDDLLDMAIRDTRNISFELAPPTLAEFGLAATIEELCQRLSAPALQITSAVSGFGKRGDLLLETTIFRMIQELINNSMKHSGASHVHIQVRQSERTEITVTDNGKGFALNEIENEPHGMGLASIRNRLSFYNGKLEILSSPGKGTTVKMLLEI